jgi:hypothetical protein
MLAVRASADHHEAPVKRCGHEIGDCLAVDTILQFPSRHGSLDQGVSALASRLLQRPDGFGQCRLASDLGMKIGKDAPDRAMAQNTTDREEDRLEIGLQRSQVAGLGDP